MNISPLLDASQSSVAVFQPPDCCCGGSPSKSVLETVREGFGCRLLERFPGGLAAVAAAAMTLIFPSWRVVVGVAGGAGAGQGEEGCVGISALVSGGRGRRGILPELHPRRWVFIVSVFVVEVVGEAAKEESSRRDNAAEGASSRKQANVGSHLSPFRLQQGGEPDWI